MDTGDQREAAPAPGSGATPQTRSGLPGQPALPAWTEWLVRFLDDGLTLPGTRLRFGADALVGLVLPVAGDALGALFSVVLLVFGLRAGVPRRVLWAMAANTALDTLAGFVPVLGDLFDLTFKANRRNLQLLKAQLARVSPAEAPRVVPIGALFLLALMVVVCVILPLLASVALIAWLFGAGR